MGTINSSCTKLKLLHSPNISSIPSLKETNAYSISMGRYAHISECLTHSWWTVGRVRIRIYDFVGGEPLVLSFEVSKVHNRLSLKMFLPLPPSWGIRSKLSATTPMPCLPDCHHASATVIMEWPSVSKPPIKCFLYKLPWSWCLFRKIEQWLIYLFSYIFLSVKTIFDKDYENFPRIRPCFCLLGWNTFPLQILSLSRSFQEPTQHYLS